MNLLLLKKSQIFSIAISSLFVFNLAFAGPDDSVLYITKDTPTPYAGILFPIEKAAEIRKNLIETDTLRAVNESYAKSIRLYQDAIQLDEKKTKLLEEQNDKLSTALSECKKENELQKTIWFTLGVLATGFAFYGAKKITQ